jgi:hypothetical protein
MHTAFISGHTDLTSQEFTDHYVAKIDQAIKEGHHFVIGHSSGADTMGLNYLSKHQVNPQSISIYVYDKYQSGVADQYEKLGVKVVTGYTSYGSRDGAMTKNSHYDILWVRPPELARQMMGAKYKEGHITGTERNLTRRQKQKQIAK